MADVAEDPAARVGLPPGTTACLFDLDGVLTRTAVVHQAAWKAAFDAFLRQRDGEGFQPFTDADYNDHVDGKPRADGVRDFLTSRGIELPEGEPDDPADAQTVNGLGNRKNEDLLRRIRTDGVDAYDGSVRYLHAVRDAGLRTAVVSSSANCRDVIVSAGIADLLEERVDGSTAREQGLRGKPAPDTFLAGAKALGVEPAKAAVFEDATSGVQAGAAGGFAAVVGVDRLDDGEHADALRGRGATLVVTDLAQLLDGAGAA